MLLFNSQKSAQSIWALFFCLLLSASYLQTEGESSSTALIVFLSLGSFALYSEGIKTKKQLFIWILLVSLIVYSFLNSKILGRSVSYAPLYLCGFHLYCCFINGSNRATRSGNLLSLSAAILFLYVVFHCYITLRQYYLVPIRTIGMFRDYSQASFATLIGFCIAYPRLKSTKYGFIVTLFLFAAFFSSFSRTSNFLLLFLVTGIAIYEFKLGSLKAFLPHLAMMVVAYITVLSYPIMVAADVVTRGGLEDLKTLNSRVYYWTAAAESIKHNWLWGTGIGSFQFTGIRELVPFEEITFVHNDYLEVLHDLGIFWFIAFVLGLMYWVFSLKPFNLSREEAQTPSIEAFIAWLLLLSFCLYMAINFIVRTQFFIIVFVMLVAYLVSNEHTSDKNA